MSKITLNAHPGEISKGIEFIREVLTEKKVSKKEIAGTLLTAEEVLAKLIANSQNETDTVQVQVKSFLGNVRIHMSCRGDQFDIADLQSLFDYSDEMDVETEVVIRNLNIKILTEIEANQYVIKRGRRLEQYHSKGNSKRGKGSVNPKPSFTHRHI